MSEQDVRSQAPEPKPETVSEQEREARNEFARLLDKEISIGEGGVELKSLADLERLGRWIVASGLAPKNDKLADVVIKIQAGLEIGFSPLRALACLTAINGRMGIMGDAAKALIRSRKALKPGTNIVTVVTGEGEARHATVTAWRNGMDAPTARTFSIADAKRAGLLASDTDKKSPWIKYPDRMLGYRALGFLVRDDYSDVLMGLYVAEEIGDFGGVVERGAPVREAAPSDPDPLLAGAV